MTVPERHDKLDVMQVAALELYLAGASSQSKLTEIKLRRLLDLEFTDAYSLEIIDVLAHPERADQANVLLTPTLVRTMPRPMRRLVGTLDERDQVLWLLSDSQKPRQSPNQDGRGDTDGQILVDLCPDGIVLVDKHGEIIMSNATGLRIMGLEGQRLDGQVLGLPLSTGMAVNLAGVSGKPIDVSMTGCQWNDKPAFVITIRELGDLEVSRGRAELAELATASDGQAGIWPGATEEFEKLLKANAALTRTIEDSAAAIEGLRVAREELERSNSELQSFAHRVAHDIRAPLRTISQTASFVLEDEHDQIAEESRDNLKKIPEATKRLDTLLDSLLTFARVDSKQDAFTDVDLNNILKWVTSDLEPMIKASFGVCDVGSLPRVTGDSGELYQLFLNLVGNAVKYHRSGVPPIVKVSAEPSNPGTADEPAMVRLIVSDNGIGFDEDRSEQIFEPFTRLVRKKDFEGSGIGLATVKKIVTRHGGTVRATGKVGEGATFTIELVECSNR